MQLRGFFSKFLATPLFSPQNLRRFSDISSKTFLKKLNAFENQIYLSWSDENYEECLSLRLQQMKLKQQYYKQEFYAGFSEDCCKIGVLYNELSDDASALSYFSQGLQRISPENHAIYADLLHNTGVCLMNQGKLQEAANLLGKAKISKKSLYNPQEDGLSLGTLCLNLANIFKEIASFPEAKANFFEAIECFQHSQENFPKETALNLANVHEELASLFFKENCFETAQEMSEKSLDFYVKAVGERHLLAIKSLCNGAGMLLARKKFSKARELLDKAEKLLGNPNEISWTVHNLVSLLQARLCSDTKNPAKAREFLRKAEKNLEIFNVEDLAQLHLFFIEKSAVLAKIREFSEALSSVQHCLEINEKLFGPGNSKNEALPQIFAVYAQIHLFSKGNLEETRKFVDEALKLPMENQELQGFLNKLKAIALEKQGNTRKAEEFLAISEEIMRKNQEICFLELVDVEILRTEWGLLGKNRENLEFSLKTAIFTIDFAINRLELEEVPELLQELKEKRAKVAQLMAKGEEIRVN